MDWMSTNGNVVSEWSNRTLPSNNTQDQKGRGVAWEHIITLSNYLKINPWVNIPHLATDDYVANLAMLLRDTLSPDLVIHVEYSNEVWNFGLSRCVNPPFAGARALTITLEHTCIHTHIYRAYT
eukprot:m.408356 g.408356  ORF g.408356 m.408356 type:complete len:124 (-) comp20146_c0_seq1:95-466(-)